MILKVYIRKHLFHLPRKQDDLTEMIKEKFYQRKPLVKSGLTKLYRISNIEEDIEYEKDVNIFLINLYLLVLENDGALENIKDIQITLSDENIKNHLAKIIKKDIKDTSIDEIEKLINEHLTKKDNADKGSDNTKALNKVEFSIDWVKNMDRKLRE